MAAPVFMLQDGAVDELMSVVLATRMPTVDLVGIGVANADCLGGPTVATTRKLLHWLGRDDIPVGVSSARGVNPFPWEYRPYAMMVDLLPILNRGTSPVPEPATEQSAEELLIAAAQRCGSAGTKLTVLVLCPLTPLVNALRLEPSIAPFIGNVVWMGGALDPGNGDGSPYGNVDPGIAPGANPNAEWNAFWDPFAVADTLESGLPLQLFPLNVTNSVQMNRDFILELGAKSGANPIYDLAGQVYAMVAFQGGYSFWDTVTTVVLQRPDLFTFEQQSLAILTRGPAQGTLLVADCATLVDVAQTVQVEAFYEFLLDAWAG